MNIENASLIIVSSSMWPYSASDTDVAWTKIAITVAPAPSDEKRSAACFVRALITARVVGDDTRISRFAP